FPQAISGQSFLPQALEGQSFYQPSDHGYEKRIAQWMAQVQILREKIRQGEGEPLCNAGDCPQDDLGEE
ncbi:MAG TPA: hypothetical protein VFD14_05450, partial [Clostridia bacterium]|nr:hypothetical protein [Clostridia bacterium]